ncbi:MAG: nucleoside monophosphate kinase, partial [Patescibacteria group bacterium]
MNRTFLLIGPPGSGKGEQAKRLAFATGMVHIPMGSLIRRYCQVPREGNICELIEQNYKRGIPQTDVVVLTVLREYITTIDASKGVIFDAFPLSIGEAESLPGLTEEFHL